MKFLRLTSVMIVKVSDEDAEKYHNDPDDALEQFLDSDAVTLGVEEIAKPDDNEVEDWTY